MSRQVRETVMAAFALFSFSGVVQAASVELATSGAYERGSGSGWSKLSADAVLDDSDAGPAAGIDPAPSGVPHAETISHEGHGIGLVMPARAENVKFKALGTGGFVLDLLGREAGVWGAFPD